MDDDNEDGWEVLTGPPQYTTNSEKHLHAFCMAAALGDVAKLQQMLDAKLVRDVNSQSPQKRETAMHYACRNDNANNLKTVEFLFGQGADLDLKDFRGKHSLLLAVAHGHLHIVKFLIENGANLHIVDKYNRSCVHWAAMHKYFDIVKLLLESGARVHYDVCNNWQPLHEAVKGGSLEIVKFLIENKAEINVNAAGNKSKPYTPLHIAAREGHTECLNYLLDCKAEVNAVNQGKQTPLHEAAFRGSKDCCRDLILRGADPHAKNLQMRTPLLDACNQGKLPCAIYCLDAGSFINHKDRINDTALHHLLKNHGRFMFDDHDPMNPNDKKLGAEQLVAFADVLLQYGANPNAPNDEDETPLTIAETLQQNREVVDLMYKAMEKPRTLLHLAKIACRRILRCDSKKVWTLPIPKTLQVYLIQNSSYYSGW
ncbi:serine/threonine-protein phosphatase 6 regulatory ankyrin repeat subunit A-like [Clytia hemisphaerica]|uniref:SOCS box domain-containing protein n=1 Tax=Clytia hemisphaerica TaxID=252671 RepID=A0A7M5XD99_9CNID